MSQPCPCGTGKTYEACCQRVHTDQSTALSAESLMRSRYSAFVLENEAYLLRSWLPEQRPESISFDKEAKWLGLKIKSKTLGQSENTSGTVHFVARYKINGKAHRIEENSTFKKLDGIWYYEKALNN